MSYDNRIIVQTLLREYGQAMRGDWGSIDGREVKSDLEHLADLLGHTLIEADLLHERIYLEICPRGSGHWADHCDEDCGEG